jgi:hypothetical protein
MAGLKVLHEHPLEVITSKKSGKEHPGLVHCFGPASQANEVLVDTRVAKLASRNSEAV